MARRLLPLLLAALIVAGCSTQAQTSSPTATSPPATSAPAGSPATASPAAGNSALCASLTELRTSFGNFASVVTSGNVTAAQLKTAWDNLKASLDQFRAAAADVQNTSVAHLRTSLTNLKAALDNINSNQSTSQKAQALQTAAQDVIAAFQETSSDLNCQN